MLGQISNEEARVISDLMPGNQNHFVGQNLQLALENRSPRKQEFVRYVDLNIASSGDGKTWDGAFKTISEAITDANLSANDGRGTEIIVAPGEYIEVAADVPALSSDDNFIHGIGAPEDTLWYGSGTAGTKDASTDDLLTITGSNNIIEGLALFTLKNDKAAIVFDDSSSGGNSNIVRGCYFSPQTQDLIKYNIRFDGGSKNQIYGNRFFGALTAAIHIADNTLDADNNIITDNYFVGTGIGVNIAGPADNTIIARNYFIAGVGTSEDMTNAIVLTAGMTAGSMISISNKFSQSLGNSLNDGSTGTTVLTLDASYGS